MRDFQDRLLHDFDVKQVPGENGKMKNVYVYKGDYAVWDQSRDIVSRTKRLEIVMYVLAAGGYIWGAFQTVPMNASHLVGAFTLCTFVALMTLIIGIVEFLHSKEKMYLRDCRNIHNTIVWSSMFGFLLQAANVASAIAYLVMNRTGGGIAVTTVLVMVVHAIVAGLLLVIWRMQKHLGYRKLEQGPHIAR